MRQGKRSGGMVMGAMSARVLIRDSVHPIEKWVTDATRDDLDMLEDGVVSEKYIYARYREQGIGHEEALNKILGEPPDDS